MIGLDQHRTGICYRVWLHGWSLIIIVWWAYQAVAPGMGEDDMGAWIGLVGVVAGALIALVSQYLIRNSEARERRDALLLEQLAMIITLSGDYRDRVW